MENTTQIQIAIRSYLEEKGLSNVDLAKKLGVTKNTVGSWVNGKTNIANKHWLKLHELIEPYLDNMYDPRYLALYNDTTDEERVLAVQAYYTQQCSSNLKMFAELIKETVEEADLLVKGQMPITPKMWWKLHPLVNQYLYRINDRKEYSSQPTIAEQMSSQPVNVQKELEDSGVQVVPDNRTAVPVISFAQASGFDPMLEPIEELWHDSSEFAEFSTPIKDGMFAIKIEGESMEPLIPAGSCVLVDSRQLPKTGKPCIAKFSDTGQVVCKIWSWRNGEIRLSSINPDGDNFGPWDKREAHCNLLFRFPVIEMIVKF